MSGDQGGPKPLFSGCFGTVGASVYLPGSSWLPSLGQWPGVYGERRLKLVTPAGSADAVYRTGESLGERL